MVLLHDRTATDRLIVWSAQPLNAETPAQVLSRCPLTPVDDFFVRNHGSVPALDAANYLLTVGGRVRSRSVSRWPNCGKGSSPSPSRRRWRVPATADGNSA